MIHEKNKVILRSITPEDVTENYLSWLNDEDVTKGIITSARQYTMDMLRKYVDDTIADETTRMFVILDKSSGKHIGNIKLYDLHSVNKTCGLGLMIGDKSFWGKGYATDACNALADIAFDTLHFRKIWLVTFKENAGAIAMYQKVGFKIEGLLEKHVYSDGQFVDEYFMALFPENRKL